MGDATRAAEGMGVPLGGEQEDAADVNHDKREGASAPKTTLMTMTSQRWWDVDGDDLVLWPTRDGQRWSASFLGAAVVVVWRGAVLVWCSSCTEKCHAREWAHTWRTTADAPPLERRRRRK